MLLEMRLRGQPKQKNGEIFAFLEPFFKSEEQRTSRGRINATSTAVTRAGEDNEHRSRRRRKDAESSVAARSNESNDQLFRRLRTNAASVAAARAGDADDETTL